jgi:hypothetical protein
VYLAMMVQPIGSAQAESGDRTAAAKYVAVLSADLAAIARRYGLETLGYILDMAQLEAENESRHGQSNGR